MDVIEDVAGTPAASEAAPAAEKGGIGAALDKAFAALDGEGDVPLETAVKTKETRATAKADKTDAAADEDPASDADPASADPAAAPAPKAATLEPPQRWPAERKQVFAKLPPEAQKEMLALTKDLEGGFTRKAMELSDQAKFAEAVRGLWSDDTSRAQMAQVGLDEVGYVRYLHSLQRFATQEPARYIAWAMQSLGVRPEQLGIGGQPQQTNGQQASNSTGDPALDDILIDPAVKELRQEFASQRETIQQLQARLQAEDQRAQQYQQQQRQARAQAIANTWQEFRATIDDSGQLAFPHADVLMRKMGALMETDPEIAPMTDGMEKLIAAYEQAMWATPSLRTARLDSEKAAADAAAAKVREAEKAKRATGPKRAQGAPTVPARKGGIAAALDTAIAQHGLE